ncbi:MAG: hypothetical protein JSU98_01290 [Gemmatimonadales bacterium]|jgi:hypothetical protein|nr:MAG: hypothetical protein JSU98_01290 [Gemmatimonadales bacterium]
MATFPAFHPAGTRFGPGSKLPRLLVIFLAVAGWSLTLPLPASAQGGASAPCSAPEYRAFDFWIGEWDVFSPDGRKVGANAIRSTMGGCVLHESYDGQQGFHGESFNSWDALRGVWHQSWMDNSGTVLLIEGGVRDGAMVLEGTTMGADGATVLNRITWTVLNESGDRVRQHWQASTDGGETWTQVFDGEYRRRSLPSR